MWMAAGASASASSVIASLERMDGGGSPALEGFVPELRALLEADEVMAFGVSVEPGGPWLTFAHGTPPLAIQGRAALAAVIRTRPSDFEAFDPAHPDPAQRNRVLSRRDLAAFCDPEALPIAKEVFGPRGLAEHDYLRALVCDGPALLAWVGAFRREPFSRLDQLLFAEVLPALHRRLVVERSVEEAPLAAAALSAALEAVGTPAFLLREEGRIVEANAAGRALFERDASAVVTDLRAAIERGVESRYRITPLERNGAPHHYLALMRSPPRTPALRASAAAARWALTPRQRDVLALVVMGHCNKAIAAALGCAERTVELHVTACLAKAGCDQRAQLVAKFWTEV